MTVQPSTSARERRAGCGSRLGADALAVAGLAMLGSRSPRSTWGTWGDLDSDTGYDVVAGDARRRRASFPYIDFVYYYGPLAPLLAGLVSAVAGPGDQADRRARAAAITAAIVARDVRAGADVRRAARRLPRGGADDGGRIHRRTTTRTSSRTPSRRRSARSSSSCLLLCLRQLGSARRRLPWAVARRNGARPARAHEARARARGRSPPWRPGSSSGTGAGRQRPPRRARHRRGCRQWRCPRSCTAHSWVGLPAHRLVFENLFPRDTISGGGDVLLRARMPLTPGSFVELGGRAASMRLGLAVIIVALAKLAAKPGLGTGRRGRPRAGGRRRRRGAAIVNPEALAPRPPVRLRLDPARRRGRRRRAARAGPPADAPRARRPRGSPPPSPSPWSRRPPTTASTCTHRGRRWPSTTHP